MTIPRPRQTRPQFRAGSVGRWWWGGALHGLVCLPAFAAGLGLAAGAAAAPTPAPLATADAAPVAVRLSLSTQAGGPRIEPAIYGHFVEHLGAGVYGGLWVGPESTIPNVRGWRRDVVDALRALQVPVMRWPGGCFADDYDWRDGIGEPSQRPVRLNKVWGGVSETNRVGTHEFMDLAEQLGAEVYLASNMGSMPPRGMAQWLEYLTSDSPDSSLAQERRRNGRAQPWRVKYFGVGNETWGCGGQMRPAYAADLHRQYANFVRGAEVKVASGDGEGRDEVTDTMMARAKDHMDALSLHYYTVTGPWAHKGAATGFDAATWALTLSKAMGIEQRLRATEKIMDKHDPKRRVALFVDEWGTWHDAEPGTNGAFLFQQNTLRDAMVAALSFNSFHAHTARVRMANIAQMVNVLQALVLTDGPRMLRTPTYHVFDLYRPFQGATPLKLQLNTPRYRQGPVSLPAVQASAARTTDGRTVLALLNLDPSRPARVSTSLHQAVQGRLLTAPALDAHNRFDAPDTVQPVAFRAQPTGQGALTIELPAKSILVVSTEAAP